MTAFRCTAKRLKAMKAKPVAEPTPATNRLGEWTASLVRVGRIQLVLAVSEPPRFAVVLNAAPYATVPERFSQALFKALPNLDIPKNYGRHRGRGGQAGSWRKPVQGRCWARSTSLHLISRALSDKDAHIRQRN